MKALQQLNFLKIPFRKDEVPEEDGRVLALFRNRAELKKAYGELQEEIYRLKDRIKQQEGATQRVQEMLGALEARLGLQESAYPALVFYQLRRLWQSCRELIEAFIADLVRQQDERERRQHVAEHNRKQFGLRQELERQLAQAQAQANDSGRRLTELEATRARLTRFWHYFKRRSVEHSLVGARSAAAAAQEELGAARAEIEALEGQPVPEFSGLSLETRRAINLAALSFAEVLCVRLSGTQLVKLAREATGRREATDEYGTQDECEALMREIDRAHTIVQSRNNIAQEVKLRTDRLKAIARYRNPPDTTPTAESIAFSEGDAMGSEAMGALAAARVPNVLAEDTFDLYRILLR
ncbi:MAG TPA: hypothetical protein VGM84_12555 [Steroidobacteraceae bacterium]